MLAKLGDLSVHKPRFENTYVFRLCMFVLCMFSTYVLVVLFLLLIDAYQGLRTPVRESQRRPATGCTSGSCLPGCLASCPAAWLPDGVAASQSLSLSLSLSPSLSLSLSLLLSASYFSLHLCFSVPLRVSPPYLSLWPIAFQHE